jgi:hypothetical protein
MAKGNRFPSDANKKPAAVPPGGAVPADAEGKKPVSVEASPELVQVHYKLKNHHHLDHVYCLAPGVNHLPKSVWEQHKGHPAVAKMVEAGELAELGEEAEAEVPMDDPEAEKDKEE